MINKIWSYELEKGKQLQAGSLLLAEPFLMDENFSRTVVLICEHDNTNGTLGLILNKPVKLRLNEVIPDFPSFKGKIFLGGPVGTDTMQFLHKLGNRVEGSVELSEGLYWGGNFEQIRLLIESNNVSTDDITFYIGYSGWGANQLMSELKQSSWIIAPSKASYVFEQSENLWKDILTGMGGVYEVMAGYPESPILN